MWKVTDDDKVRWEYSSRQTLSARTAEQYDVLMMLPGAKLTDSLTAEQIAELTSHRIRVINTTIFIGSWKGSLKPQGQRNNYGVKSGRKAHYLCY